MKLLNILKDRYKKDYNIIQIYASNYVIGNYLKLGFHIKKDINANEKIDGITLLEAGFGNELYDNTKLSNEEIRNYGYGINNSFNNFFFKFRSITYSTNNFIIFPTYII